APSRAFCTAQVWAAQMPPSTAATASVPANSRLMLASASADASATPAGTIARSGGAPQRLPRGSSARRCAEPDRAAHAGAAEAAIAGRVLRQILLMVVLGEVERRRIDNLGRHRAVAALGQGGLERRLRCRRGGALRGAGDIDAGAILRADVVALAHALGRIVAFPERLEQPLVGDFRRVVDHEHHLVVAGAPGADLLIGRVRR